MNPGNWIWIVVPAIWIGIILAVRGPKWLHAEDLSKQERVPRGIGFVAINWRNRIFFDPLFNAATKWPRHKR